MICHCFCLAVVGVFVTIQARTRCPVVKTQLALQWSSVDMQVEPLSIDEMPELAQAILSSCNTFAKLDPGLVDGILAHAKTRSPVPSQVRVQ